jgi:N utilization substance protein A
VHHRIEWSVRVVVENFEDQLSLAIGKRGQNVRLAARLTNWDIDILTPPEFTKSLDIMESCLKQVTGITEEQIDRLAALGVISVFDVEEVGPDYLAEAIGVDKAVTETIVKIVSEKAKIVAEEQAKEKAEAERKKKEQAALLASGGTGLDDILGGGALTPAVAAPTAPADAAPPATPVTAEAATPPAAAPDSPPPADAPAPQTPQS